MRFVLRAPVPAGFGLWFSVLRGQLSDSDLSVLSTQFPDNLWITASQLLHELRPQTLAHDTSAVLLDDIVQHHPWATGTDKLLLVRQGEPHHHRCISRRTLAFWARGQDSGNFMVLLGLCLDRVGEGRARVYGERDHDQGSGFANHLAS